MAFVEEVSALTEITIWKPSGNVKVMRHVV